MALAIMAFVASPALAKDKCTTIQSGELLASDGTVITTGYDQWGYNYQAHLFNGGYCDAYRDAAWCQDYKDVQLSMKWNDAWLSNKDCDNDGKLDRHLGLPSYIGSGAWVTNHQSGTYENETASSWDVTGDWDIAVNYNGTDYIHVTNIVQTGTNLTGTLVYPGNTKTITSGSVVGNVVTIVAEYTENGPGTVTLNGIIAENGSMSGTWLDTWGGLNREGTWTTASGEAIGTYETCNWNDFVKIVAVPADAYSENGNWYTAGGDEIGPVIWGEFAIIQEVYNDTCTGDHGLLSKSLVRAGLGNW